MLIEKKSVSELLPAEYNPRKDLKPGDKEYEKLKLSITEFGYVEPVIWNKTTGRVVGGHQRLKVLMDMGIKEVECVVVEMPEEKEKALNIALNKISGEWDNDKLALLISDLQGTDFDVSLTGFEAAEIDDLFKADLKDGIKDDDFDVEEELKKPTITKAGDIWTLGNHRLICGDSTKEETLELLMCGKKANLVVTDPPYNVNYEGSAGKIKNDNMEKEAFFNFLKDAFTNMGKAMADDASVYIFHADSITLDAIKDKLLNTHGGYLQVRYTNEGKVLDYLSDYTAYSLQTVEYGKNLLDVKINQDHGERYTALIPLGAKIKSVDEEGNETETEERVSIAVVNNGTNYVYDEKAVKEIGWIWTTEVWDDVTIPGNLLTKAKARIMELAKGITSMELTIVDESDTGADIGDIRARQYVYCKSPPHGIDGRYLCVGKTKDYLNPAGNTITIGASGITLSSISAKQNQNLSTLEQDILGQTVKIENISGKVDDINNSKMYRTELIVDGVNIFRDKGQQSTMRCKVYSWDKDITDTLEEACFIWHRKSNNETTDADWDSQHIGTKSVIITTEDVQDNASFFCEVNL